MHSLLKVASLFVAFFTLSLAAQAQELRHRFAQVNGIRMHYAERGSGPLVVLVHGFPESWYSWRHQISALAAAGYRVVAPDMRGYGQSDVPPEVASYSIMHLVGDVTGLVQSLGEKQAFVVGHDWGATVAWAVSSLLFAAAHAEPAHVVLVLPLGLWFGFLRWRSGSLWPSLVAHIVNNGMAVVAGVFIDAST